MGKYIQALILFLFGIFTVFSFASALDYSDCTVYGNCKPSGTNNINNSYTNINNTYINQTVNATINSTQFDSNNPIHIKESWLTSFINNILNVFGLDYYNKTSNINATGYNITATYFIGNGSLLTGISAGGGSINNTAVSNISILGSSGTPSNTKFCHDYPANTCCDMYNSTTGLMSYCLGV